MKTAIKVLAMCVVAVVVGVGVGYAATVTHILGATGDVDIINLSDGNDQFLMGSGNDYIDLSSGNDNIYFGAGLGSIQFSNDWFDTINGNDVFRDHIAVDPASSAPDDETLSVRSDSIEIMSNVGDVVIILGNGS